MRSNAMIWWMVMWGAPVAGVTPGATAQDPPLPRGTSNVRVLSHVPLGDGPAFTRSDLDMEQELARPYVYIGRNRGPRGFDIVSVADPEHAEVIYRWRIENDELHVGNGGQDNKYFKVDGRYYLAQSFQFRQGGPDADLGAIVFDLVILRPGGFARFVLGSAITTIVLPIALITGQTEEIVQTLIGDPAEYTFVRELGDF